MTGDIAQTVGRRDRKLGYFTTSPYTARRADGGPLTFDTRGDTEAWLVSVPPVGRPVPG